MSGAGGGPRPLLLAVTGGIGSGKSTALAFFSELGAATLSSDAVVHALYCDPDVLAILARRFGGDVVREDCVDRRALAHLVFRDVSALAWLEQFTHPRVRRFVEEWAEKLAAGAEPPDLAAVEVPLLFEGGDMVELFDLVLLVTAPQELRRRRLAAKLTPEEFARRAERQLSEEAKAERSDFVYENEGSRRHMKEFVAETYAAIVAGAAARSEPEPAGR